MQGLMHTFSLAMFCKLIICGQSVGSAMVPSAWPAVVYLCLRMFSTSFLWMKYWPALQTPGFISSGLACITLLRLWTPKFPCVGEVIPFLSHGFMSRFGRKCLPMLLYTLTRGIWEALVSIHPCPTLAIVCCLYYRQPRHIQCILELYCVLCRLSTRPSESTVATSSVTLLIVSNCITSYQE